MSKWVNYTATVPEWVISELNDIVAKATQHEKFTEIRKDDDETVKATLLHVGTEDCRKLLLSLAELIKSADGSANSDAWVSWARLSAATVHLGDPRRLSGVIGNVDKVLKKPGAAQLYRRAQQNGQDGFVMKRKVAETIVDLWKTQGTTTPSE